METNLPLVPVSAGELLDKISILEIKNEFADNEQRIANVANELKLLRVVDETHQFSRRVPDRMDELRGVNRELWHIEDEIRECEQRRDFSSRFIELARSVYVTNDRRAAIKRKINMAVQSSLVEEKIHPVY